MESCFKEVFWEDHTLIRPTSFGFAPKSFCENQLEYLEDITLAQVENSGLMLPVAPSLM